jgi:hypothetical protein
MNINTENTTRVSDVNNRSYGADLRYSETQERWTMSENVQKTLGLDEQGLQMHIGFDEETDESVILLRVVDKEDADFFKGSGNIFTAHRLRSAVEEMMNGEESLAIIPLEDNFYALQEWEGQSEIMDNIFEAEEPEDTEDVEEPTTSEDDGTYSVNL